MLYRHRTDLCLHGHMIEVTDKRGQVKGVSCPIAFVPEKNKLIKVILVNFYSSISKIWVEEEGRIVIDLKNK